ncbi:MAG: UbiA prenyltransferase family protein [Gaiellaceae bacterium]
MSMLVEPRVVARRRLAELPLLAAMRPRQWTKNLVVFGGLLFAGKLDDLARWELAAAAFAAFCAISSAAYLVNDVRDVADDRNHPVKRLRPIASGRLAQRSALLGALALAGLAFAIATALGGRFSAWLAAYAALQVAYTLGLKRVPGLDVALIAAGFVVRTVGGTTAVHVHTSDWILLCTALLAAFLGFSKRRGERVLVERSGIAGRAALRGFPLRRLDLLVCGAAAATIFAYVLYTLTARDSIGLLATVPLVVLGLGRYLYLVYRHDQGEEPERVLFDDAAILAIVCVWAVAAATIVGSS